MSYIDTGMDGRNMTYDEVQMLEAMYPQEKYTVVFYSVYDAQGYVRWESNSLVADHEYAAEHPAPIDVPAEDRPEKGYLRIQISDADASRKLSYWVITDWDGGEPLLRPIPLTDQEWIHDAITALEEIEQLKKLAAG